MKDEKENEFEMNLGNLTQEEIEKEDSYKVLKEEDPLDLLKAILEEEQVYYMIKLTNEEKKIKEFFENFVDKK